MALIVQKFGGTSVGSAERIRNVARRVAKWRRAGHDIVAGALPLGDAPRDVADALRRADRSAAEFLHDQGHGKVRDSS